MLPNVKERLIEEARDTSYKRAGEKASYGTEISKQTVKNEINKLEFKPEKTEEKENKKKVKKLCFWGRRRKTGFNLLSH